jgi:esterase/lipase superfamily enzyme
VQKRSWSFAVAPLGAPIGVTRWGHYGLPLLLFASAGGDSLEPERMQLIQALGPMIDSGHIKVYAVDGTAMRLLLAGSATPAQRVAALLGFDEWVGAGLVPEVRRDCHSDSLEMLACGCAFGAASALQALLRHPQLIRGAIGVSGTYDLVPWITPAPPAPAPDADTCAAVSPLQWPARPPQVADLAALASRSVTVACAAGDYENQDATTRMASRLREHGVVTRTELWGPEFNFGFASWRAMLPRFVGAWL